MCGLAGFVDLGGLDTDLILPRIDAAVARLRPRGPDGEGRWHDHYCALGHTRLAIIDLSSNGAQPMAGHGGVIVHNGEVYNHQSLRADLARAGHRFRSRSDTEVLLAGWRHWHDDLFDRLRGMFAFALWDPNRRALVLVRDRFGKKPLLFWHANNRLAFASDLVALDHVRGERAPIDPVALRLLFTLRFLPDPVAMRAGVQKLPPGHLAIFTEDGLTMRRWYQGPDTTAATEPDVAADQALKADFDSAVADRLVADVPVGVYLSGGIDSALVAASVVAQGAPARSFTVGFRGAAAYFEERPAAAHVARHLGCDHTEVEVGADDALAAMDAVFEGLDEPFGDSSALPSYVLARATRGHVKVVLSGDGADEVFGGYRRYRAELYADAYRRWPGWLRHGVIEPLVGVLPESKTSPLLEHARRLRRFVAHGAKPAAARQAGFYRLLDETALDQLLGPAESVPLIEQTMAGLRASAGTDDSINAMLAADIALVLPSDMLVKVDRMSMANSLEVRCPFLDHRVVARAAGLPGHRKVSRHGLKRVLREAFADRLPAAVFRRPKKGFELPIAEWLTGPLAERTRAAIDPGRLRRQGLFNPKLPNDWYDDLVARRRDMSEALWTLVAFQAWCDHHDSHATAVAAQ